MHQHSSSSQSSSSSSSSGIHETPALLTYALKGQADRKNRSVKRVAGNMATGGIAAVLARFVIAPMERIKIRYQVTSGTSVSLTSVVKSIYQEEGVLAFWRGVGASVTRVGPYFGIKFMALERYKEILGMQQIFGVQLTPSVSAFFAGSVAGMTAVVCTYPFDIMRARMAAFSVPSSSGAKFVKPTYRAMYREIIAHHGFKGLYRGMSITLKGICVHDGVKFGLYDLGKKTIVQQTGAEPKDMPFWGRVVSGALSGLVAQTIAYPTDVIRRRVQTSDAGVPPYRTVVQGMIQIYKTEGFANGLFRGWTVNCFKSMPNIAMYMSLYDILTIKFRSCGW